MKFFITILLFSISLHANPGLRPDGKLDMSSIQVSYREGELDLVKSILEGYLKSKVQPPPRTKKFSSTNTLA